MRWIVRSFICCLAATYMLAQPTTPQCAPMPTGVTAWWPFSESPGMPAHDIALADNLAVPAGVFTAGSGAVGTSLCFNGSNTSLQTCDQDDVDFLDGCPGSQPIAIDFWIKTTQAIGGPVLLDKRQVLANFLRGYDVHLVNGRPGFQMATGAGSATCGTSSGAACTNYLAPNSIADGKWHFVAIRVFPRCGPNAKGTFWVDGGVVATFVPRQGKIDSDAPLTFGHPSAGLGSNAFTGCLDEVEIHKKELTDAELLAIFKAGPAGKCAPCVVPPSVCPAGKPQVGTFLSPAGAGWGKGTFAVCLESPVKVNAGFCSAAFFPNADHRCDDYKGFSTQTVINGKNYCVYNRTNSTYYNAREIQP